MSVLIVVTALVLFVLCGCCVRHDWQEATCTEPEACSKCGETRGEALGHDWQEATCTESETCSICGETRGDPLGHKLTEATCTEPATCTVCGATEGEALGHTPGDWEYGEADYTTGTIYVCQYCQTCGEVADSYFESMSENYMKCDTVMERFAATKSSAEFSVSDMLRISGVDCYTVTKDGSTFYLFCQQTSSDECIFVIDPRSFDSDTDQAALDWLAVTVYFAMAVDTSLDYQTAYSNSLDVLTQNGDIEENHIVYSFDSDDYCVKVSYSMSDFTSES